MSRFTSSIPPSYFDGHYADDPDPWHFETSAYEHAKYDATLAALPQPHYASALEVGCSIGVLTRALAARCDEVVGVDVVERALARARETCRDLGHVRFERAQVPVEWPAGLFDLILLSEMIYFLDPGDVARLAERVRHSLRPGGVVVLVHWTGETHYPLSGDEAAHAFIAASAPFLSPLRHLATETYRLDVLADRALTAPGRQP
ncbi:class I SAM-dependent DNA methyltransferase [Methylobacterium komagatae]